MYWACEAEAAGAPQIPALAFSLAMLARLGPLLAFALDLEIPALALAVDQREPKASPEDLLAVLAAGLLEVVEAAGEEREGLAAWEENGWAAPVETEVK